MNYGLIYLLKFTLGEWLKMSHIHYYANFYAHYEGLYVKKFTKEPCIYYTLTVGYTPDQYLQQV